MQQAAIEQSYGYFPYEILEIITKYANARSKSVLLQTAKLFARIMDEETWKIFYLLRWHWKNLFTDRNNYSDEDLIREIEQHLSVRPNDYVEAQFYDKNAWKNRYKYRAQLELAGGPLEMDLGMDVPDLYEINANSLALYNIGNMENIQYSNLSKVDAHVEREYRGDEHLFKSDYTERIEANCTAHHAIVIGHTGAPVRVRVEIRNRESPQCNKKQQVHCNLRLLAYNNASRKWDIISAQYSSQFIAEDILYYYRPYCKIFCDALILEDVLVPGKKESKDEKYIIVDVFQLITAAVGALVYDRHYNVDAYFTLDSVMLEDD